MGWALKPKVPVKVITGAFGSPKVGYAALRQQHDLVKGKKDPGLGLVNRALRRRGEEGGASDDDVFFLEAGASLFHLPRWPATESARRVCVCVCVCECACQPFIRPSNPFFPLTLWNLLAMVSSKSMIAAAEAESSPDVGSSRNRIAGDLRSSMARESRFFCPPRGEESWASDDDVFFLGPKQFFSTYQISPSKVSCLLLCPYSFPTLPL